MIYTTRAKTADDAAGDQTTKTNVIRTENTKRRGINQMEEVNYEDLKKAIEIFLESHHFSELQKAVYEAVKYREDIVKKLYFPETYEKEEFERGKKA